MSRLATALALVALGLCALLPAPGRASTEPLVVIVAEDSSIRDLALGQLRNAFMGGRMSMGGKRVIPFNQPNSSSVRQRFDRIALGLEPDDAARYWIDRRIRGQAGPPRQVGSPGLLVRVVQRLPGAMAYVRQRDIRPGVRAVTINGHGPTHAEYPLR